MSWIMVLKDPPGYKIQVLDETIVPIRSNFERIFTTSIRILSFLTALRPLKIYPWM
jgi:hypothetical protein